MAYYKLHIHILVVIAFKLATTSCPYHSDQIAILPSFNKSISPTTLPCLYSGLMNLNSSSSKYNGSMHYLMALPDTFHTTVPNLLFNIGGRPGTSQLGKLFGVLGGGGMFHVGEGPDGHLILNPDPLTLNALSYKDIAFVFLDLPNVGYGQGVFGGGGYTPLTLGGIFLDFIRIYFHSYKYFQFKTFKLMATDYAAPIALYAVDTLQSNEDSLRNMFRGLILQNGYIEPKVHAPLIEDLYVDLGFLPHNLQAQFTAINEECRLAGTPGIGRCKDLDAFITHITHLNNPSDILNTSNVPDEHKIQLLTTYFNKYQDVFTGGRSRSNLTWSLYSPWVWSGTPTSYINSLNTSYITQFSNILTAATPLLLIAPQLSGHFGPLSYSQCLSQMSTWKSRERFLGVSFSQYFYIAEGYELVLGGYIKSLQNLYLLVIANHNEYSIEFFRPPVFKLITDFVLFGQPNNAKTTDSTQLICNYLNDSCSGKGSCDNMGLCCCEGGFVGSVCAAKPQHLPQGKSEHFTLAPHQVKSFTLTGLLSSTFIASPRNIGNTSNTPNTSNISGLELRSTTNEKYVPVIGDEYDYMSSTNKLYLLYPSAPAQIYISIANTSPNPMQLVVQYQEILMYESTYYIISICVLSLLCIALGALTWYVARYFLHAFKTNQYFKTKQALFQAQGVIGVVGDMSQHILHPQNPFPDYDSDHDEPNLCPHN